MRFAGAGVRTYPDRRFGISGCGLQALQPFTVALQGHQGIFHVLQGCKHRGLVRHPHLFQRGFLRTHLGAGRATIEQRKATPSAIAEGAKAGGAWKIMQPYLEALTSNG